MTHSTTYLFGIDRETEFDRDGYPGLGAATKTLAAVFTTPEKARAYVIKHTHAERYRTRYTGVLMGYDNYEIVDVAIDPE